MTPIDTVMSIQGYEDWPASMIYDLTRYVSKFKTELCILLGVPSGKFEKSGDLYT